MLKITEELNNIKISFKNKEIIQVNVKPNEIDESTMVNIVSTLIKSYIELDKNKRKDELFIKDNKKVKGTGDYYKDKIIEDDKSPIESFNKIREEEQKEFNEEYNKVKKDIENSHMGLGNNRHNKNKFKNNNSRR